MPYSTSKWMFSSLCPCLGLKKCQSYIFPTIRVESPILTASYYREYLGFSIIFRNPLNRNGSILLNRKGNLIHIKAIEQGRTIESQRLSLFLRFTDIEYSKLSQKVWVIKPYCSKTKEKFIIKDCNGIEIAYCTS